MRWPIKKKPENPEWYNWFAWHKVECEGVWVRWETIERKYMYYWERDGDKAEWYEYRFKVPEWQGEYPG